MQEPSDHPPVSNGSRRPSKDTLNLIIAVSAVLISAASFVAAYMQSDAAYRQVEAETWPFLQLDNGNIDGRERMIYLRLENVGVGPAKIERFTLFLDGKPVKSLPHLMRQCCAPDEQGSEDALDKRRIDSTTDSPSPRILPSGGSVDLFMVPFEGNDQLLWQKLNKARHRLKAYGCYCSLLGDCYETDFETEPVEVAACYRNRETDYVG